MCRMGDANPMDSSASGSGSVSCESTATSQPPSHQAQSEGNNENIPDLNVLDISALEAYAAGN